MKISDGFIIAIHESSDNKKVYEIRDLGEGRITCSCPAYRFTKGKVGYKKPCKHIKSVLRNFQKDFDEIVIVNRERVQELAAV